MTLVAGCSMCALLMAPDHKLTLLTVITSVLFCQCHRMKQDWCSLTNRAECYTLLITNAGKVHICNISNCDSPSYPLPPAVIVMSSNKGFHKHFVQFKSPAKIKYRL